MSWAAPVEWHWLNRAFSTGQWQPEEQYCDAACLFHSLWGGSLNLELKSRNKGQTLLSSKRSLPPPSRYYHILLPRAIWQPWPLHDVRVPESLPKSFPLKAAVLRWRTKLEMSPKPMLTPCPASGWTLWAASLRIKQHSDVASSNRERSGLLHYGLTQWVPPEAGRTQQHVPVPEERGLCF